VVNLREKVEELTDELAWTNNWFEDMRALETAVINLVGPAKMRKLIDKERSIAQAAGEELIKRAGCNIHLGSFRTYQRLSWIHVSFIVCGFGRHRRPRNVVIFMYVDKKLQARRA
jgi:hypothetical protein